MTDQLLPATRRALAHRVAVGQADGRTPSLVGTVVRDGHQAWCGARSMLQGHEPDGDTQYRIGSLTKTFVAVLVMRLRDEGRLDLADPLGRHLDAPEVPDVTIAQLLSHTAGLASEAPGPWCCAGRTGRRRCAGRSHDPDEYLAEALDGAYPALARLRADGTVGAIGVGVNSPSVAEWFLARCDLDCVLIAGRYTLLDDAAAASLFPLCLARGVAVLAAGVFNSGILAGGTRYDYVQAPPGVLARARRIAEICARYEIPVAAAALRYILRHPAVTAAVVGARTPREIRADAGYLALPIPDALWAELDSQH